MESAFGGNRYAKKAPIMRHLPKECGEYVVVETIRLWSFCSYRSWQHEVEMRSSEWNCRGEIFVDDLRHM
jgi:hypothetical protein